MINKKECNRCKITKSLDLFYNNKNMKDGKQAYCKECYIEYNQQYSIKCNQLRKESTRKKKNQQEKEYKRLLEYYEFDCEKFKLGKICKYGHDYKNTKYNLRYKSNGGCVECSVQYRQSEKVKVYQKEYYQTEGGKKVRSESDKRYRQTEEGKKVRNECNKRHRQSDKSKKTKSEYDKCERKNHTLIAIGNLLRNRVWYALKDYSTTGKIKLSDEYGIDYEAIIKHLGPHPNTLGIEGKFHIDHKYPLSLLNLNNPEHIKVAFDPLNHKWLSAEDNLKKGNKIPKQCDIPKTLLKKLDRIGLELY